MTALYILEKHTGFKTDKYTTVSPGDVLAAMKEIYEMGFKDGGQRATFNGYPGQPDAPTLEERVKQLFPEK